MSLCPGSAPSPFFPGFGGRRKMNLREGKGHQGPTDHNEVQDIPQVTEVGARVQQQPQVNHLQRTPRKRKSFNKTWPKCTLPKGRRRFCIKGHKLLRCSAKLLLCNRQENSPRNEAQINKPQPKAVETRALTAP